MTQTPVALLGFGNVAQAFARYLLDNDSPVTIRAVADSSAAVWVNSRQHLDQLITQKAAGFALRTLHSAAPLLAPDEMIYQLRQTNVSCLVESLPTNIEDGQPALARLAAALRQGIHVVTVDKGPLVHGFAMLQQAAREGAARLAFTGTTGVAIPDELAHSRVLEIRGVLNGTTNHILTAMQEEHLSFDKALRQAQEQGVAEPNPALDVEGWDTACKILILAKALLDTRANADASLAEVSRLGIGAATQSLIDNGRQSGRRVRLVGRARIWQGRLRVSVAPKLLDSDSPFYAVGGAAKAAVFRTAAQGEILAVARSGRDAISQVILDDIMKVTRLADEEVKR